MATHELKTWPEMFQAVLAGIKTHEIRKNDRPYAVGDVLHLQEFDPTPCRNCSVGMYTGATLDAEVTFITAGGEWGIPDDLCVMSIRDMSHDGVNVGP